MSRQKEVLALIEVGVSTDCFYIDSYMAMGDYESCIKNAYLSAYESLARRVREASSLDMNSPQISLSHSVCFSDSKPDEERQVHRSWLVTIQAHIRLA